jgi:hypothetical protein
MNCAHDGTLPPREPGDAPCYACHSRHVHGGSSFCKHCGVALPKPRDWRGLAQGRRCKPCLREYEAKKQDEARRKKGIPVATHLKGAAHV